LVQKPVIEQFLNIQPRPVKPVEYIAEPDLKVYCGFGSTIS